MSRYFGTTLVAGGLLGFSTSQAAAINSGITQSLVDDIVYKSSTQTITGFKTFNTAPRFKSDLTTSTITPIEQEEINLLDVSTNVDGKVDGASIVRFRRTDGARFVSYRAGFRKRDDSDNIWPAVNVGVDANDSRYIELYADNAYMPTHVHGTYFHGIADYANYADLAEMYRSDSQYPVGTLIKFGGEKDITLADDEVNGVISDKPGFVLDAKLEDAQPVALVGKTPIRIIGKVKRFDKIVLSEMYQGVGRIRNYQDEKVIAIALEDSLVEEEKLVMCVTKFTLD